MKPVMKQQAWLELCLSVHRHVPCPHRTFRAHLPERTALQEPIPTAFLPAVINKEPAVEPIGFQRRGRTSWREGGGKYYLSIRARVPPDGPVRALTGSPPSPPPGQRERNSRPSAAAASRLSPTSGGGRRNAEGTAGPERK